MVSEPAGAAEEGHVPLPLVSVATQRVVAPVVNVTVPVGVGKPVTLDVTVAE